MEVAFWEPLVQGCPPADAVDQAIALAFRVVFNNPPTLNDFRSQAARGLPLPIGRSMCDHQSCSLFTCKRKAIKIANLPKIKPMGPSIAHIAIPPGSGRSKEKNKHIHFWMYSDFDPISASGELEIVP